MAKFRSLLYVHDKTSCQLASQIFNHEFQLKVTHKKEDFFAQTKESNVDIGIICCCYAAEKELKILSEIKENVAHLPLVICSKIPNPDFISKGVKQGFDHFILCNMSHGKIRSRLKSVILEDGLRVFINSHINPEITSPYTERIVTEFLNMLPGRVKISEIAKSLGLSTRWTQSLLKEIFGMTYSKLTRRIFIYQALQLMKSTNLDNTEIAMKLEYSDENSLFRLFSKELGYSPTKAREYIHNTNPQTLLASE